jgi:hypothetical protein
MSTTDVNISDKNKDKNSDGTHAQAHRFRPCVTPQNAIIFWSAARADGGPLGMRSHDGCANFSGRCGTARDQGADGRREQGCSPGRVHR